MMFALVVLNAPEADVEDAAKAHEEEERAVEEVKEKKEAEKQVAAEKAKAKERAKAEADAKKAEAEAAEEIEKEADAKKEKANEDSHSQDNQCLVSAVGLNRSQICLNQSERKCPYPNILGIHLWQSFRSNGVQRRGIAGTCWRSWGVFNIEVCKFDHFNVCNAINFNVFHPFWDVSSLLTVFCPAFLSPIYLRFAD